MTEVEERFERLSHKARLPRALGGKHVLPAEGEVPTPDQSRAVELLWHLVSETTQDDKAILGNLITTLRLEALPKRSNRVSLDEVGQDDEGNTVPRHERIALQPFFPSGRSDLFGGPDADWTNPKATPTRRFRENPWHGQKAHWETDPVTGEPEWVGGVPDLPDLPVKQEYQPADPEHPEAGGRLRRSFTIPVQEMWNWSERQEDGLTRAEAEVIYMKDVLGLSWNQIAASRLPRKSKQNQIQIAKRGRAKLAKLERP